MLIFSLPTLSRPNRFLFRLFHPNCSRLHFFCQWEWKRKLPTSYFSNSVPSRQRPCSNNQRRQSPLALGRSVCHGVLPAEGKGTFSFCLDDQSESSSRRVRRCRCRKGERGTFGADDDDLFASTFAARQEWYRLLDAQLRCLILFVSTTLPISPKCPNLHYPSSHDPFSLRAHPASSQLGYLYHPRRPLRWF
jgi:hypothetical protein